MLFKNITCLAVCEISYRNVQLDDSPCRHITQFLHFLTPLQGLGTIGCCNIKRRDNLHKRKS